MNIESAWALSLWQPWASLWLTDCKVHETRDWATKYRGPLYVHAGKRPIRIRELSDELIELCEESFGKDFAKTLPLGSMVGIINLIDCVEFAGAREWEHANDFLCGNFAPGRFGWRRGPRTTVIGPWPYRGRQSLFRCDDLGDVANRQLGIATP